MLREVKASKRDVCQGDICRTEVYRLDDNMTVREFLHYLAGHLLMPYLHYQWEIAGGDPRLTLGFIACNGRNKNSNLKTPGDVCDFLTRQYYSDDLIQCCVPPDQTLKDLNITWVACIDL